MNTAIKLAIFGFLAWVGYRLFFRKRTPLENHLAEQNALRQLGYETTKGERNLDLITSFFGIFPLAEARLGPSTAMSLPEMQPGVDMYPTANGLNKGSSYDKDNEGYYYFGLPSAVEPPRNSWGDFTIPTLLN